MRKREIEKRLRQFIHDQEKLADETDDPFDKRRFMHGAGVLMDVALDIAGVEPWPGKSGGTGTGGEASRV